MSNELWPEVCQVYEQSFEVLEAARERYDTTCQELVERVDGIGKRCGLPSGFVLGATVTSRSGSAAGRWVARWNIATDSPSVRFSVEARLATPFGGPPQLLRIGVTPDVHWLLRQSVARLLRSGRERVLGEARDAKDTEWINVRSVKISETFEQDAGDAIGELYAGLTELAHQIAERVGIPAKALDALIACWPYLKEDDVLGKLLTPARKADICGAPWRGLGYIQVNTTPAMWLGVHPVNNEIRYAHQVDASRAELPEQFAERLGVERIVDSDHAEGVLATAESIERESHEELRVLCLNAFQTFHALLR